MRRLILLGAAALAALAVGAVVLSDLHGPLTIPEGHAQQLRPAPRTWQAAPFARGQGVTVVRHDKRIPNDLIPNRWTAVNARAASNEVRLDWQFGDCESRRFDVFVTESVDRVVIDLWNDQRPTASACNAIGHLASTTVRLRAPLGRRTLLKHRVEPPVME